MRFTLLLKTLIIILFTSSMGYGQFTTEWERKTPSTDPSWFLTGNAVRGLGYGYVNNNHRLYIAYDGNKIKILNANTGADVGDLTMTGVSGGTRALNIVKSAGGKIFGANLTTSASSSAFKVYMWDDESGTATAVVSYDSAAYRLGDHFNVIGSYTAGTAVIYAAAGTTNRIVLKWVQTGANSAFTSSPEALVVPNTAADWGTPAYVAANEAGSNSKFWAGGRSQSYIREYTTSNTTTGYVNTAGISAVEYYSFNSKDYLIFALPGTFNARIQQAGGPGTTFTDRTGTTYGSTPALGATSTGGTGDVAYKLNHNGTLTLFVLSTNNGIGAYTTTNSPFNFVDGDLSNSFYTSLSTKQNSNSGFGANIDLTEIVYYADTENEALYLGIKGKLDVDSDNGIGVWLNVAGTGSPAGAAAGNELGFPGAGHYMDGEGSGTNDNFKADFEVDYMFAFNPGGAATNVYWDAAKTVGGNTANYQGTCNQSGTTATNSNDDGTVFSASSINFAFNNGGGANQGLEMRIPFSEIGATSEMTLEVFAFVVSASGFFSDVTVPGNILTEANPGFNADFGNIAGGPFNSGAEALPVELQAFTAKANGSNVNINWATATEVNSYMFEVERSENTSEQWLKIGEVSASGNSNSPKEYSYNDKNLAVGKYSYRLKIIDNDGTFEYSNIIESEIIVPAEFTLSQNYPNPFNPVTTINYTIPVDANVQLYIFSITGELVQTLVNEQQTVGSYSVNFDGRELASGTYIYRLVANDFVQTKKMILIK